MTENTGTFPWEDFSLWLKEGIVAATIVNKFMLVLWKKRLRPSTQSLSVQAEELDLLRRTRSVVTPKHHAVLDMVYGVLTKSSVYQSIPEDKIQSLWDALREYATNDQRFNSLKDQLTVFLKVSPDGAVLMKNIWGSLGPAVAHPRMIGHTQ